MKIIHNTNDFSSFLQTHFVIATIQYLLPYRFIISYSLNSCFVQYYFPPGFITSKPVISKSGALDKPHQ